MKNTLTLKEIKPGECVIVIDVHGLGALRRRILDMGITGGVKLFVKKTAPLGDPMQISLRGYELTLRKEDAGMIEVERC